MPRNEKGQAYLYVVILMTGLLSLLSIALYITGYEVRVTSSYIESAQLYPLAVSGAEEALLVMEGLAASHRQELLLAAKDEILTDDLPSLVEYRLSASYDMLHEGDFYLKQEDAAGLLGESDALFAGIYGKLALDRIWKVLEHAHYFSFDIDAANVSVIIIKDKTGLLVRSTAREGDLSSTVEGRVAVDLGKHEERLIPVLGWATPANFSSHSAFACGEILIDGPAIHIEAGAEYQPVVICDGISLPRHAWSEDEPFVFTNNGPAEVDVSLIYSQHADKPVFTAVYSSGDVKLSASDPSKRSFYGIVAAVRNIEVQDANVSGSLIAGGHIIFKQAQSAEMNISKDDTAIFRIGGGNTPLYRKWLDKLGVTAFYNIDPEQYRNTGARLEALLNNACFLPEECSLEIRGASGRLFGFEWLRETDG